ncbi:hypothetical protein D3C76_1080780 [compost metagenome]
MTDGCQKGALGAVGIIGLLLGLAQVLDQLASLTDIDPAADDALDLTERVPVRQDPVVNGHCPVIDQQRTINDQWHALAHHLLVVGLNLAGIAAVAQRAIIQAFAQHLIKL